MDNSLLNMNDIIEIGAKTALSVIPVGGTLITSVWDSVKGNCAQRRLDEWKELVEVRLSKLEITLEDIGNNERFTTAIMKATESALKTMETDKRKYLADAVMNSITCELSESVLMMYFDFIDRYTLWHLKILNYFLKPMAFPSAANNDFYMGSPMLILLDTFPELKSNENLVNKIAKDLYLDGLLNTADINVTTTKEGRNGCLKNHRPWQRFCFIYNRKTMKCNK